MVDVVVVVVIVIIIVIIFTIGLVSIKVFIGYYYHVFRFGWAYLQFKFSKSIVQEIKKVLQAHNVAACKYHIVRISKILNNCCFI